jgi:hypothetical protein
MPRTRAPDGCERAREPKSRVRHPLAFDWPVAARLKPTMSLTSWPINPWSRIWNLLTKPSNGDGDLGRCSRTRGSRSSASRAGDAGVTNVERLIAEHGGDARLPDLLETLAHCQKARSVSIYDRCRARYDRHDAEIVGSLAHGP